MSASGPQPSRAEGQLAFDLENGLDPKGQDTLAALLITYKRSKWLIATITNTWEDLGFARAVNDDQAFFQLVAPRLIQPSSLNEPPPYWATSVSRTCHRNTLKNALWRVVERD